MVKEYPVQLNDRVYLIDGFDLGLAERTGTYVIKEDKLTLVETGPSPSVEHVKKGLADLGFELEQVEYIIVTHVHLDHAGGAGLLLKDCPNAKVVVHPKGARHLADPGRLVAGAKMVYGDRFSALFDPVVPIPENRLIVKGEGDRLELSDNCSLEFWDTPGHAKHHFGIYDPVSNGIFAGDTAGIRYEQLAREGIDLYVPSTSPNQFDPQALEISISRMSAKNLDAIYYGHFGMTTEPAKALEQIIGWLAIFMKEAEEANSIQMDHTGLAKRLLSRVREHLQTLGVRDDHEVYMQIELDMQVSAMGIMEYITR